MTPEQINTLIESWLGQELEQAENFRATEGPFSENYREDVSVILSDQQEDVHEALMACDYRKVANEADESLKSASLPALNHDGALFGKLCRQLLQAKQEYQAIQQDRWNGRGDVLTHAQRPGTTELVSSKTPPAKPPVSSCLLFSVGADKFIAETITPNNRSIKPLRAVTVAVH